MAGSDKQLRVTRSVVLNASGTGSVTIGPSVTGPRGQWNVTGLVAQTTRPGQAPIPRFQAYRNEANPQYSLGLTYDGSFASATADEVVLPGQTLVFVWSGGQSGDVATVVVTGTVS